MCVWPGVAMPATSWGGGVHGLLADPSLPTGAFAVAAAASASLSPSPLLRCDTGHVVGWWCDVRGLPADPSLATGVITTSTAASASTSHCHYFCYSRFYFFLLCFSLHVVWALSVYPTLLLFSATARAPSH